MEVSLIEVGDLIAAFKQKRRSLLVDTDDGFITLCRQNSDGDTLEALECDYLLTELGEYGSTSRNPSIIK